MLRSAEGSPDRMKSCDGSELWQGRREAQKKAPSHVVQGGCLDSVWAQIRSAQEGALM